MQSSYWSKVLGRRVRRRKALIAAGGSAAAAAFLAACGGDDDEAAPSTGGMTGATTGSTGATGATGATGSTGGTSSGLVTPARDTFAQATRGGTLKDFMNAEPRSLDPVNPQASLDDIIAETVQTLVAEEPGHLGISEYQLTGALADSWEVTPDGLQVTFHLRKGTKWHPVDPVNGRVADSEDVLFSFGHHQELAPLASLVWNSVSSGGFVLEPQSPDASTITLPLSEPVSYAVNWFSAFGSYTGQVMMYPKEAANAYDPRQKIIGTGPFYISAHEPSVSFTLSRNPDYFDQDFALVDEILMPILPEYAARQVQLKAGEVHFGRPGNEIVRAEDILLAKEDQPELLIYAEPGTPSSAVMTFGHQGENPYKDERVRQAISMAFDRDLDIEVRFNTDEFEQAGIPVETYWNSHLVARPAYRAGGWWLDPQGSDFGPNAKYFQNNLEEAKALLTAAGYADGFEVQFGYPNAAQFDRGDIVEPYFFYLQQLGLQVVDNGYEDYTQGYIPLDRDASGNFEGMGYHSVTGGIPSVIDPASALIAEHLPESGVTFHGYSVDGQPGDPVLMEILRKAKVEQDVETRKSLLYDAQRHLGKAMWNLTEPGGASGYMLAWPAVMNFGVWYSTCQNWEKYRLWLDQTKPPFV